MSNEAKEAVCVCGCTESEHHKLHEKSHYPESRSVETWEACNAHGCVNFRPCLPWPTEAGWWWINCEGVRDELVEARMTNGGLWLEGHGEHGLQDYWPHGPARFTRLIEPNPFTT